ncbi:MAG TPA: quinolinate synthase NadA [Ignavibacteriaceae bacterium]|nr:quinolinate synthase NadA [Ignavibacteriaceae bacterium]HRN25006.1 quinolinate synthase NadA [Ignavibacteriaceae bacterium]HRP93074.1 quinolinate synthase NadA [Ignavibacteriaceae bacterium]HRQ52614.1 quinolinate synthase NadA [Ignavibacteriaceae bacterium]
MQTDIISKQIDYKAEIVKLKEKLNAVILAHYYQESEIQDIADFVGDSLELAKKAKSTSADVIVFAGVHFMAETAKILNPEKLVLLPDLEAGCSLAEGCPADQFEAFRKKHPNHIAITYINCSADVKALSDIICTSSSAEKIINQIPKDQKILFSPDRNLGKYLIKKTGREMLLWDGSCVVHETFSERKILDLKVKYPLAKLISHPECEEPILMHSDFIGSTSKLLSFVKEDSANQFIVATETGIIHQMKKAAPQKEFIPAPPEDDTCSCNECPYMKLNTLEKLYLCMENQYPEIIMDEEIRKKALLPIEKMLAMS